LKYGFSTAEVQKIRIRLLTSRWRLSGIVSTVRRAEPTILRQGANEIVVQLPGAERSQEAVDIIGKTAQLEFKLVDTESPAAAELPSKLLPGEEAQFMEKLRTEYPRVMRSFSTM